jgi:hypothetical protein
MSLDVAALEVSQAALGREVGARWREARSAARLGRGHAAHLREAARKNAQDSIRLRWRARQVCYDSHGPVVAMWNGDKAPQPAAEPAPQLASVPSGRVTDFRVRDSFHTMINRLFAITVEISGALTLNGNPEVGRRLREILDDTDEVIREVRVAASAVAAEEEIQTLSQDRPSRTCPSEAGMISDVQSRQLACSLLVEVLQTIDRLARFARANSEAAAIELDEASHAAHRALVVLAGS